MARDTAQVWRDWLAAGAALVVIVGGVGAVLAWTLGLVVGNAVSNAVPEAVKEEIQPLEESVNMLLSDVEALKQAQALTLGEEGNPVASAVLFPQAPWVPEFETWAANLPPGESPADNWTTALTADSNESWVADYRDWYKTLMAVEIPR